MRYLIFIILFPLNSIAQQTIELCDNSISFTYSTYADAAGTIQWEVGGEYYFGNEVSLTWTSPGIYSLTAQLLNNECPGEPVTYYVTITECKSFYVPNSFTPDDGEFNQTWGPVFASNQSLSHFQLMVFNRWGEIIWESKDPEARWDGTYHNNICQDGTYIWKMVYGFNENAYREPVYGHVNILK
jgi:gliding motility-associated-like protein